VISLQALVGAEVGRPRFRRRVDGAEAWFFVDDSYCSEPGCEGDEVAVELSPVEGSDAAGVRLWISLETRHARWDAGLDAEEEALIRAFVHDEGMLRLLERRRQLSRAWRAAQGDQARRPAEDRLYALGEFAARVEQFAMPFAAGSEAWAAFDHYCVAPRCACEKVVLDFYGPAGRSPGREVRFEFGVRLDLATGEVEGQPSGAALTADQRRILAAFQGEVGRWREELSARRRLARRAARRQLSRDERTSARASAGRRKTGRNERCPCGSGQKYKRCCGRAVARRR